MTEQIQAAPALNGAAPNGHAHHHADEPARPGAREDVARDGPRTAGGGLAAALARDPLLLAVVKQEVEETTESYAEIARRFGLPKGSLNRYALRHAWRRPQGAPRPTRQSMPRFARSIADGATVAARLLRVVDRQVGNMDVRLRRQGAAIDEKDARLLVHLAKTLQTIMALGRDGGAGTKEPADRDEVDADLARRIALWAEGREEA